MPTRIVMSSQYLSVNAGKKESVQKLYPEINLFIEETNNSLKEASKQVRNYMKLFAKEAEEKVFLVEKNAHAILNSFLGGKAATSDPLSVIVIQRMEDDFKKELDYIAVDYVLKMLGISKNFTVLKEKVKNNFYYEGGEVLREITRYEPVEDEIVLSRP